MSSNVKEVLDAPILQYDTIDSTNNHAARIIDADKSVPGMTIIAAGQSAGKGQRGNSWKDEKGASLLMSIILKPKVPVDEQFSFSAAIAVGVADAIQQCKGIPAVQIKFPNDIVVNDKKAGGILIENTFRGSSWTHAVAGIGINLYQRFFGDMLPNATSLTLSGAQEIDLELLIGSIRGNVIRNTMDSNLSSYLFRYNELLYKKGEIQALSFNGGVSGARICGVSASGKLGVELDGKQHALEHGAFTWVW